MTRRSRDWRGNDWAVRSRAARRRSDGSIRRCRCCLWRRSQETHHLFPGRRHGLVPLCAWCHHKITAVDRRSPLPTFLDTWAVILRAWLLAGSVSAVAGAAIVLGVWLWVRT